METAREQKPYKDTDTPMPGKNRLTEEQIEDIHKAFIETGGFVRKTAKHTGFGKSTVSRYAKARGWYEELSRIDVKMSDQKIGGKDEITVKLRRIRQLLFDEIMEDENPDKTEQSLLKIAPRTLSEVVKALIDVDKRISELEDTQRDTTSNPYQKILENCMKIAKANQD